HDGARCPARYALRLSFARDLAVSRRRRCDDLARVVRLVGAGVRVGVDSAGHCVHRLVLAEQEGIDRRNRVGEITVKRRESTPASVLPVRRGTALDVSALPSYGFSHRSLMWWGNAGMMTIEGGAFGFMIVIYFYLRSLSKTWPEAGAPPDLLYGNINLAIILLSAIPNYLAGKAAINQDRRRVRFWLYACSFFGVALCLVRWYEFGALNVRWDDGVYGSAIWI